mmetsp:Transcript_40597/g.79655  ORF Transcript_40597/g.79655 Transcript_40597/m.79655 type:complete len:448 (+) Transcript_40597:61-1404(+)
MSFFHKEFGGGSKFRRPEASGLDRKRTRKRFADNEEGSDDDDEEEQFEETAAFLGISTDKTRKRKHADEEDEDSDEGALDGEDDGSRAVDKAYKGRDRTKYMKDQLSKQGIEVEGDEVGNQNFVSGKERSDYAAPSREAMEKLFGKDTFSNMESFSMSKREHVDKSGRVLEDEQQEEKISDAWYDEVQERSKDSSAPRKNVSLSMFAPKKEKKAGLHVRTSDNPMMNCRILLTHMQPGETVMHCLRRLGQKPKGAGDGTAANNNRNKQKRQRTKPSKHAIDTEKTKGKADVTEDMAQQIAQRKQAFDEVTAAANTLLQQGRLETYEKTHEFYSEWMEQQQAAMESEMAKKREAAAAARAAAARGGGSANSTGGYGVRTQRPPPPGAGAAGGEEEERGTPSSSSSSSKIQTLASRPAPSLQPPGYRSLEGTSCNPTPPAHTKLLSIAL